MERFRDIEFALKIESADEINETKVGSIYENIYNDFASYFKDLYNSCLEILGNIKISRIYYGIEFCEFRIPKLKEVEIVLKRAKQKGLPVTFLTPPVTQFGIEKIRLLLPMLYEYDCEISINDYGVLELLKEEGYKGKIICGRILDKLYHDGRMNSTSFKNYTNSNGYQYLRSAAIDSKSFHEVLLENGVSRFDVDLAPQGVLLCNKYDDFSYSVFLPYSYITTGRICMMRNYKKEGYQGFDLTKKGCLQHCRNYDQLMVQPLGNICLNSTGMRYRSVTMMRKGNTIFFGNFEINIDDLAQFDRVILQSKLML